MSGVWTSVIGNLASCSTFSPSALPTVSQSLPVSQLHTAEVGQLQLLGNFQAKMVTLIELMLFICM